MHPPVSWTYPEANAAQKQSTLIGQPLTQTEAQNTANGDLTAAALEALSAANIPTQGVRIVSSYTPPLISDCEKVTPGTPAGGSFGVVEQGAVTQRATITGTAALTDTVCISRVYPVNTITYASFEAQRVTLQIEGVSGPEYQWEQVASRIQSRLNFNNRVQFLTPVTVN
ncbi:hypothetical protein Ddc_17352 [Ditylenchus destructor]|nr:hypothetical protein Ddc_17352 [Ditylenchus destructor]